MFFSVITKGLNWEILTKNFVTSITWVEVKDEKFQYYGGSLKNWARSCSRKTTILGELPKREGLYGQFKC